MRVELIGGRLDGLEVDVPPQTTETEVRIWSDDLGTRLESVRYVIEHRLDKVVGIHSKE